MQSRDAEPETRTSLLGIPSQTIGSSRVEPRCAGDLCQFSMRAAGLLQNGRVPNQPDGDRRATQVKAVDPMLHACHDSIHASSLEAAGQWGLPA